MKSFTFSLALVLLQMLTLIFLADPCTTCTDDSWIIYKREFKKNYSTDEEDQRRRSIFCDNLKMIVEHNEKYLSGQVTYEMGVNQFADWTTDEFHHWLNSVEQFFYVDRPITEYKTAMNF